MWQLTVWRVLFVWAHSIDVIAPPLPTPIVFRAQVARRSTLSRSGETNLLPLMIGNMYIIPRHRLYRSKENGANLLAITSADISIDSFSFYVVGATPGDTEQPKVVMVAKGTINANDPRRRTSFTVQATAVQRSIDI